LGFFNFQLSRTRPRIAASAMTINPTTHRLRATVKNKKRNAIIKIYTISRMQTSNRHLLKRTPMPERRFPPPWSVEDIGAAFVVTDKSWRRSTLL
jgi:hypothetical protein